MSDDVYVHVNVNLTVLYFTFKAWILGKPLAIKILQEIEA